GAGHIRPVGRVVELIQGLASFYLGAFLEQPFLDDAAHLGADLRDPRGPGTARHLACERHRLGREGDHGHRYRSWLRLGWRFTLARSEEHTSELQSRENLVCRLLLEKKKVNLYSI